MYADDTSLSFKSKILTQLNEAINDDLMSLESWLKGSKISLNVAKTHTILICSKSKQKALINSNEKIDIKVKDENLMVVEKIKYLTLEYKLIKIWNGRNILNMSRQKLRELSDS